MTETMSPRAALLDSAGTARDAIAGDWCQGRDVAGGRARPECRSHGTTEPAQRFHVVQRRSPLTERPRAVAGCAIQPKGQAAPGTA
jgi:hypothetical protein